MNVEPDPRTVPLVPATGFSQSTAIPSPFYRSVKADILATLEKIHAHNPEAADHHARHIIFDDATETVTYTGAKFPNIELS